MPLPKWKQFKNWSLPSKYTFVALILSLLFGGFGIYAYFNPYKTKHTISKVENDFVSNKMVVPVSIYNSLGVEAWVLQEAEYFILKPETPLSDVTVEAGGTRLSRPKKITTINNMYPVSPHEEIQSSIIIPRTKKINKYLKTGGYKLRLIIRNSWSNEYGGHGEIYFDKTGISQGINVRLEQYKTPNKSSNLTGAKDAPSS